MDRSHENLTWNPDQYVTALLEERIRQTLDTFDSSGYSISAESLLQHSHKSSEMIEMYLKHIGHHPRRKHRRCISQELG